MRKNMRQEAAGLLARSKRRRTWQKVVSVLGCVVVFCTTYALILPAITLEGASCDIPEHTHVATCYTQVTTGLRREPVCTPERLGVHEHTADCLNADGEPVCGYADFVVHTHNASCYDGDGNLWCPLREIKIHTHGEACYAAPEAPEVHTHTDDCYTMERGELICTESADGGHIHTEDCYTQTETLLCQIPESQGHTHGEGCYDEEGNLICGTEESEGHQHVGTCWDIRRELTCGQEEVLPHQHTEECYAWNRVLTCELSTEPEEEPAGSAEEAEPVLICNKEEIILHEHVSTCFDGNGNLICGKTQVLEHVHSDDCFETVEGPADTDSLTCTIPEGEGAHTHGEECYDESGELVCRLEESEGHRHGPLCYGTWELTCELQEHTHSLACYSDPTADVETAEIWERTLPKQLSGVWAEDLLAVAESQLGYTESTRNYVVDEEGNRKGYTRYGDWYGSTYADWCGMFVSFCLRYANVANFPLNAGCDTWIYALSSDEFNLYARAEDYQPRPGVLIFFDWEGDGQSDHVGIVAERIPATETEGEKLRTIEGNSSNTVRYVTYDASDRRILGYGKLPEQESGYTCGKVGHTHSKYCYRYCVGPLLCGIEEHVHTEECVAPEEEEKTELRVSGEDYTILVRYGPEAGLPQGTALSAEALLPDTEAYQSHYQQAAQAIAAVDPAGAETLAFARFFDLGFALDGEAVEPVGPVEVTITYNAMPELGESTRSRAIHFGQAGTELLDVTVQWEGEAASFTHIQNSFSVVGDLVTLAEVKNPTDVGPNKLPVDYYVCIDGEWTCVGSTKTGWYGDYNAVGWTDTNRDYITVEQAASVLEGYGFDASAGTSLNKKVAYQQKSGNTDIYADVNTPAEIDGQSIVPLSRNENHPGYNLYYIPGNSDTISNMGLDDLNKDANGFYTVKVYDSMGQLLTAQTVRSGGSFTYDASESGVRAWLVSRGSGSAQEIAGSTITIDNITAPVTVSPKQEGKAGSRSVTFKVMVDGQWKTVGSLPYYYSGSVSGSQRAYITSGMAAQFFGDYGYTATTDPGYHFGYSYNDIYEIYFKDSNYCMDIADAIISEETAIQLYEANHTNAQTFRIWEAETGYSYITPVTNSGLHVNVYGGGSANDAPIKLSGATDDSSRWRIQQEINGWVSFWTKNAPDSACIDLDSGTVANRTKIHIWNGTENRYWRLSQVYRISNNTVSELTGDGTYHIGLTGESNGDIVCYYLPAETAGTIVDSAESGISTANSFWSVTVRDDTHTIYSDGELSKLTKYAQNGGDVTITVHNGEGMIWSCESKDQTAVEVEETQSGGYTTFVIKNVTQPVEVVATKANPSFTVQYYAVIPQFATSGSNPLKVIDTTGGVLPSNGGNMATKTLYLEGIGRNTNQNNGKQTELYRVSTKDELIRVYSEGTYQYETSPGLEYFNKLKENEHYNLTWVGVLKEGKDPENKNDDDWDWYKIADGVSFTNVASEANKNTVLISDGAVLRLWYNTTTAPYYNGTTFYDYDISSGYSDGWRTGITGINSKGNYGTSLNGQRNWDSGADVLAFGNQNCGTGMGHYYFDGGWLNAANDRNSNYAKCTFGLVQALNSDGTIRYNDWIVAPKLFNDGDAAGKWTFAGSSLTFDRVGDTYTLSAATLKNSNGQTHTINELQYFFHPSPSQQTVWDGSSTEYNFSSNIFTNNFWPMDYASGSTDALWGAYGNPGWYQGFTEGGNPTSWWEGKSNNFPVSDDGRAHNWFFGMNFAISFNLTADYVGPLEYIFFGDDDMWVFLDGQLVCDIGGVHSSIGEYVNLRDYLPEGSSGQHTLSFFYTERGASGSTCYMQFTLPSVSSATTARDTGSLQLSKTVESTDGKYGDVEYEFKVELLTGKDGSPLTGTYPYALSDGTYGTVKSGGTITLHADETATISGIPAGSFYRVTELTTRGYKTTVNGAEGYIVSGTIENGDIKPAAFVNTPYHELPQTGGSGTLVYTFGGIALMALTLMYDFRRRRKGAE